MYNSYIQSIKLNLNKTPVDWSFKSDNNYTGILEHVNVTQGIQYLNCIKTKYSSLYENNTDLLIKLCNTNDKFGETQKELIDNFTICSPTNLRYIFHSFLILTYMQEKALNNIDIIEIGGGYGGLCFYIYNLAPLFNITINTYSIFDLLEASMLQKLYLEQLNITNAKFYQLDNFTDLSTNSFLISNYAFSEISMELQQEYSAKILNPYTSCGFLSWNFINVYEFINNKHVKIEPELPITGNPQFNRFVYFWS